MKVPAFLTLVLFFMTSWCSVRLFFIFTKCKKRIQIQLTRIYWKDWLILKREERNSSSSRWSLCCKWDAKSTKSNNRRKILSSLYRWFSLLLTNKASRYFSKVFHAANYSLSSLKWRKVATRLLTKNPSSGVLFFSTVSARSWMILIQTQSRSQKSLLAPC